MMMTVPNQPDSEVSVSLRHVSIESRCNSGDSQLSVQIAELKAVKKVRNGSRYSREKVQMRKSRSRHSRRSSRRNSTNQGSRTSLDSHMELINALTNNDSSRSFRPNLGRRTVNAGLDGQQISDLINNRRLRSRSGRTRSGSEDENVSVTISESKFNMRVSNKNNLDLNDQLMIQYLRQQIGDISSTSISDEYLHKDYGQEKKFCGDMEIFNEKKGLKQIEYTSNSDNSASASDNSSCPEIKNLVQSSVNSAVSGGEKLNRSSRQSRNSRTSTDVAVQTSIQNLEMNDFDKEEFKKKYHKSKMAKTVENTKFKKKKKDEDKYLGSRDYCKNCGTPDECEPLNRESDKDEDEEIPMQDLCKKKMYSKKI